MVTSMVKLNILKILREFILYGKYPYIEGIILVAWETDDRDFVYDSIIIIIIDLYM